MTDEKDANGNLLPDSEMLTKFGRILRATSLDELPEAFNIVKGDMSIIGPRPLLPSYLEWYTEDEKHRHDVRPGLSGLAQVNGRNFLDWDKRFLGDVKIILQTIRKFFTHSNIATDTSVTEGNMAKMREEKLKNSNC